MAGMIAIRDSKTINLVKALLRCPTRLCAWMVLVQFELQLEAGFLSRVQSIGQRPKLWIRLAINSNVLENNLVNMHHHLRWIYEKNIFKLFLIIYLWELCSAFNRFWSLFHWWVRTWIGQSNAHQLLTNSMWAPRERQTSHTDCNSQTSVIDNQLS